MQANTESLRCVNYYLRYISNGKERYRSNCIPHLARFISYLKGFSLRLCLLDTAEFRSTIDKTCTFEAAARNATMHLFFSSIDCCIRQMNGLPRLMIVYSYVPHKWIIAHSLVRLGWSTLTSMTITFAFRLPWQRHEDPKDILDERLSCDIY